MKELPFPPRDERPDPAVTAALEELLLPPGGDAYWARLERGILDRIEADAGWWTELAHWARPALAAAAALVLLAGAAVVREARTTADAVYADVVAATPLPADLTVRPIEQDDRAETLRFLFAQQ